MLHSYMGMVSIFLNVHPYLEKDFEKKQGSLNEFPYKNTRYRFVVPNFMYFLRKHLPGRDHQMGIYIYIHSRKLTWNLKMMVSNRNILLQVSIFGCRVSFRGCIYIYIW